MAKEHGDEFPIVCLGASPCANLGARVRGFYTFHARTLRFYHGKINQKLEDLGEPDSQHAPRLA